jgi:hypothetical protein
MMHDPGYDPEDFRCKGCRFWDDLEGKSEGGPWGLCRRYAPRRRAEGSDHTVVGNRTRWPITHGIGDWCGEGEPRAADVDERR